MGQVVTSWSAASVPRAGADVSASSARVRLVVFERAKEASWLKVLAVFGGAAMFFYVLHIYVLRTLYHLAYFIWGPTYGASFGVNSIGWVWVWYVALLVPLYIPTVWYSRLKARRKDIGWLKYF